MNSPTRLQPLERCYEVLTDPEHRGELVAIRVAPPSRRSRPRPGVRCWTFFEGKSAPCPGCPLFDAGDRAREAVLRGPGRTFRVAHVERGAGRARVAVVALSRRMVGALALESVRRAGREARLSQREEVVLTLLAWGLSSAEIGARLGVKPRTAKFHAANVLRKLGVRTRLGLVRFLLFEGPGPRQRRAAAGARAARE